eukprot:590842-Pleurochrysis_carterae.AAC.1
MLRACEIIRLTCFFSLSIRQDTYGCVGVGTSKDVQSLQLPAAVPRSRTMHRVRARSRAKLAGESCSWHDKLRSSES